jgi:hypothetical protein
MEYTKSDLAFFRILVKDIGHQEYTDLMLSECLSKCEVFHHIAAMKIFGLEPPKFDDILAALKEVYSVKEGE